MSRNLWLLVVVAVIAVGGIVGGVMVFFIAPTAPVVTVSPNPAVPDVQVPPATTIIIETPPPAPKPRAKSHHINPGQVDRI